MIEWNLQSMERGGAEDAAGDVKMGIGTEELCRFKELPEQCLVAKAEKRVLGVYPLNGKSPFTSKRANFGRRFDLALVRLTTLSRKQTWQLP